MKCFFEMVHSLETRSELPLDGRPRDELWFPVRDTMQAVSQA